MFIHSGDFFYLFTIIINMEKKFNIDNVFFNTRLQEVADTYPFPDIKLPVCLDVGANVGAFSLPMSFYCDKVISIEPFKENYDYMVSMIDKYDRNNIIPINKAIYPSDGEIVEMSVVENNTDSKDITCIGKRDDMVSLGSVETISLESIIEEYGEIDYMKVDCEVCEWDLLYGKDLSKVKAIVTEIHPGYIGGEDNKDKLLDYLNKEFDISHYMYQEFRPPSFKPTEFLFRRQDTTKYENNMVIRFAAHNPKVAILSPECPKRFNEWIKMCGMFVQPI